jgi:hypothetical protein
LNIFHGDILFGIVILFSSFPSSRLFHSFFFFFFCRFSEMFPFKYQFYTFQLYLQMGFSISFSFVLCAIISLTINQISHRSLGFVK